ncbi:MAG TPA: hypothetical protein VK462_08170 [Nitrososphaeraceae archaeon]|jgi:hypothetical protein|nr:hypothetical protein [Nitrososphaeraceae archaeon]
MANVIFDLIINTFVALFGVTYRWLEQNVINYVLNFVRGFEHVLVMFVAVAFLLITVYIIVNHVKRLPKSYIIEIVDVFGERVNIDSLRHSFTTYEAAKSYSQFYTNLYGKQYKFRVVGRNRIADPFIKKISTPSNER